MGAKRCEQWPAPSPRPACACARAAPRLALFAGRRLRAGALGPATSGASWPLIDRAPGTGAQLARAEGRREWHCYRRRCAPLDAPTRSCGAGLASNCCSTFAARSIDGRPIGAAKASRRAASGRLAPALARWPAMCAVERRVRRNVFQQTARTTRPPGAGTRPGELVLASSPAREPRAASHRHSQRPTSALAASTAIGADTRAARWPSRWPSRSPSRSPLAARTVSRPIARPARSSGNGLARRVYFNYAARLLLLGAPLAHRAARNSLIDGRGSPLCVWRCRPTQAARTGGPDFRCAASCRARRADRSMRAR